MPLWFGAAYILRPGLQKDQLLSPSLKIFSFFAFHLRPERTDLVLFWCHRAMPGAEDSEMLGKIWIFEHLSNWSDVNRTI